MLIYSKLFIVFLIKKIIIMYCCLIFLSLIFSFFFKKRSEEHLLFSKNYNGEIYNIFDLIQDFDFNQKLFFNLIKTPFKLFLFTIIIFFILIIRTIILLLAALSCIY